MKTIELHIFGPAEPFTPTHWWRFVSYDHPEMVVDDQIEIYNSPPVGLAVCIDKKCQIPAVLDPNSFVPRITFQTVVVLWDDKWYRAAIKGLDYQQEVEHDLKSVHGLDAETELMEIYKMDVADWLNGTHRRQ